MVFGADVKSKVDFCYLQSEVLGMEVKSSEMYIRSQQLLTVSFDSTAELI